MMTVPDDVSSATGLPVRIAYNRRMDAATGSSNAPRVLLVTATAGYKHQSIPTVWRTLPQIAYGAGLTVETILADVDSLERLTPELLSAHEILCLVHTSGDLPFSDAQKQTILDYVAGGHGFVGVHGATTVCYEWSAYREMLGAHFLKHPPAADFTVVVEDGDHPSTRHLPESFEVKDELYTFRSNPRDLATVLLSAAPGSLDLEGDLPLAWIKSYGTGRVYYNALGHFDATWDDPRFRAQIAGGLRWAAGLTA
jgi:type 1 glutamine amidotransferase